MAGVVAHLKHEWHVFRYDPPGQRFEHHHDRMLHRTPLMRNLTLSLGILLLAVGFALWFLPGPGTPLVVFGLALIGARWHGLARWLDKAELAVRRDYHRAKDWLKRRRERSY